MGMNDEEMRLVLTTVGTEGIEKLRDRLEDVRDQAGRVVQAMGTEEGATRELNDEFKQLSTEARNLERAIGTLAKAQAKFGDGADDLGRKTSDQADDAKRTSQAFISLGRAYQDVSQGGLASAANNVEELTRGMTHLAGQLKAPLALLGGWPGILTAVGTAAVIEGPKLFAFFKGLIDGSHEIPKATLNVEGITDALKANEKQLDSFRGKQSLTNTELETYVRLTAESVKLTERKVQLEKDAAALKDLRYAESSQAKGAKAERAGIVQTAIDGKQGDVSGALGETLSGLARTDMFRDRDILEGQIKQAGAGPNRNALQRQLADLNRRINDSIQGRLFPAFKAQAEGMLAKARQGDQDQIDAVLRLMNTNQDFGEGATLEWIRRQFQQATPAGLKDRKAEAHFVEQQSRDAKLKRDLDKVAADRLKAEQDDAVKVVTQDPAIEALADTLAKDANANGMDRISAFEAVRDQVVAEILDIITQRGGDVTGADRPARAAATGIAERAFGAQDRGVKAAAEKAKADDKKDQAVLDRAGNKDQAAQERDAAADFKAGVKNSGVDRKAAAALAKVQQQGGVRNDRGKLVPMDEKQAQAYVQHLVEQFLHRPLVDDQGRQTRANPDMDLFATRLTAQKITDDAAQALRRQQAGRGVQVPQPRRQVRRPLPANVPRQGRNSDGGGFKSVAPDEGGGRAVLPPRAAIAPPRDDVTPVVNIVSQALGEHQRTQQAIGQMTGSIAKLANQLAQVTINNNRLVVDIRQIYNHITPTQMSALKSGGPTV
jgi:hypothetical protein